MKTKELTISRLFDAPREAVWKAWTEPWRVARWWGPRGYTLPARAIDLRVGGKYLYGMRGPDGKDVWSTGTFREITRPSRLVMTDSFADESGNIVPATRYGFGNDLPLELTVAVTFIDRGDMTRLVLTHSSPDSIGQKFFDDMEAFWNESFDRLEDFLLSAVRTSIVAEPGSRDIVSTRTFDAPREVVFHAMTDGRFIPRWWGPRRYETRVDVIDFRPGGRWRLVQHDADGNEYGFHGEYVEIVHPKKVVQTFEFEGMPGHPVVDTLEFEARGARTLVTTTSRFQTVGDRDGMLVSGAEEGAIESNERLDELLGSTRFDAFLCSETACDVPG